MTMLSSKTWNPADQLLSIGVFSRRSRLSIKALRLYDSQGLLVPAHVDSSTGYRHYRESQLERARFIVQLRRLDMPLQMIQRILTIPRGEAVNLVSEFWDALERRHAYQRELASHLWIQLSGHHGDYPTFPVSEREVAEQLVLTESKSVTEPELSDWVRHGTARLVAAAAQFGGVAGPAFVIFQGDVTEDDAGLVELCVPVDPCLQATTGYTSRRELAHWEAFTSITKAQCEYPQVMSAYDAVEQWIAKEQKIAIGFPREVYFSNLELAEPLDLVCDIAQPIR